MHTTIIRVANAAEYEMNCLHNHLLLRRYTLFPLKGKYNYEPMTEISNNKLFFSSSGDRSYIKVDQISGLFRGLSITIVFSFIPHHHHIWAQPPPLLPPIPTPLWRRRMYQRPRLWALLPHPLHRSIPPVCTYAMISHHRCIVPLIIILSLWD